MSEQPERQELEDVLDAYVASAKGPHHASLTEWVRRYPQYARELTEFAVGWSLMETLPPSPEVAEVAEETLVLRGMSVVQDLLHRQEAGPRLATETAAVPMASLLAEGKARGLAPRELAEALGLSVALVRKLDRRLIRSSSIPGELVQAIAHTLQREGAAVARYLQGAATLPSAASYLAGQTPTLAEPEDFYDAVRGDRSITDAHRRRWLATARPQQPEEPGAS